MIIRAFKKKYENFELNCPELELQKGKIYCLIGANGSGKSTFAKCLSGVISSELKSNDNVGYLSQNAYPFAMSLLKNVLTNTRDLQKALKLISKMELSDLQNKNAKDLSGGQKARMSLCRILVKDYECLILDEPTAAMDMKSTLLAEEAMMDYKNENRIIILISHSIAQAKRIGDEFIFLDNGKIEASGSIASLQRNKNEKLKAFLEYVR